MAHTQCSNGECDKFMLAGDQTLSNPKFQFEVKNSGISRNLQYDSKSRITEISITHLLYRDLAARSPLVW